jgi:pyrroloquinoline quinone biosynthesis protein D
MTVAAPQISGSSVVTLARGVRLRQDEARGRMVLLAPERAMALDDIAIRIVKALDGERSLDHIATDFAAEFGVPIGRILDDVTAFIRQLAARRLLEIAE